MARPRKDYLSLNVKLDRSIMERFNDYCEVLGQTKTTALERILQKALDAFDSEMENVGHKTLIPEMPSQKS